jgi:hypothetical protein
MELRELRAYLREVHGHLDEQHQFRRSYHDERAASGALSSDAFGQDACTKEGDAETERARY